VDYADFGRYLTQQRELRGVSRADVASVTKIPVKLIAALENGDVDRLPERIFVVNYIRAYAQVIGMESQEAVLRFEEIDRTVQTGREFATPDRASRTPRLAWPVILIAVLLLVAITVLAMKGILHVPRQA
jgi:cytoskeletal protein RodZ